MNFIEKLLFALSSGFNFLGDMLYGLVSFLSKPLTYVYYFFDGVFYFLYQLYNVVVKIIMVFVAIIQFFGAIVAGFYRFIAGLLNLDFSQAPIHYPSTTQRGIMVVMEVLEPIGMLDVVPLILIAVIWALFIKKMIGLLGGELRANA